MTLRHLYIFIAVYQEMSITKAAERLHLAQPRVSQAVKELEEEYGVRLFERLNRKLFVTEKGERLYDYAVHLLELSQEMEEDLLSSGNGGVSGWDPVSRRSLSGAGKSCQVSGALSRVPAGSFCAEFRQSHPTGSEK